MPDIVPPRVGVWQGGRVPDPELLDAYDGPLEPDGDFDGLAFTGTRLDGQDGSRARFLECALIGCVLDETRLDHARFIDTTLTEVRAGVLGIAGSTWQDCAWDQCRLGAVEAYGSQWTRTEVRGGKVDYLNLRDAHLDDVRLVGCVVDELDLAHAVVRRLTLEDCRVRRLDVTGARLTDVDLRGLTGLEHVSGVGGLAGTVITSDQLLELAPHLATHLGIDVR